MIRLDHLGKGTSLLKTHLSSPLGQGLEGAGPLGVPGARVACSFQEPILPKPTPRSLVYSGPRSPVYSDNEQTHIHCRLLFEAVWWGPDSRETVTSKSKTVPLFTGRDLGATTLDQEKSEVPKNSLFLSNRGK